MKKRWRGAGAILLALFCTVFLSFLLSEFSLVPQVTQPLGDVSLARTDSEIRRILSQVKEKREAMPVAEIYRVYFNRQPSPDPDYAILSSLSQGRYPIDSRTKPDSRLQSAEYCKGCHQKEYNLWRESLHSRSFTNIRFQQAFEREPMAWCLNCHAPFWYDSKLHRAQPGPDIKLQEMYQSDRTVFVHQRKIPADSPYLYKDYYEYSTLDSIQNRAGVSCAACHVRDNVIYSARKPSIALQALALIGVVHKVEQDSSLSKADFCAGCHEFSFPASYAPVVSYTNQKMQSTVSEFYVTHQKRAGSQGDSVSTLRHGCSSCHVTETRHASSAIADPDPHAFPRLMKIQFKTESLDLKNYKLDVSLGIPEIGHHFPTGDLFRQVRIKSFDGIGNQILLHIIARDVDPNTFVTHSDTSLKVTDRQSIAGQFAFSTTTMPARCLVEFMFEGKIEHLHRHETPQKEQRIILYDGACH